MSRFNKGAKGRFLLFLLASSQAGPFSVHQPAPPSPRSCINGRGSEVTRFFGVWA